MSAEHYAKLARMYESAPVSRWYGVRMEISDGRAEVRVTVRPEFLHTAGAVHGSVYFRLLDDAGFFAANSRVEDVIVLTVSFTVHFARPAREGELVAVGRVRHGGGRLFLAESELSNERGELLGHGSGVFSRSSTPLSAEIGYL